MVMMANIPVIDVLEGAGNELIHQRRVNKRKLKKKKRFLEFIVGHIL